MGPVRMWPQATARPASLGKEEWIVRTFFFCRYLRCTCRLAPQAFWAPVPATVGQQPRDPAPPSAAAAAAAAAASLTAGA